MGKEREKGAKAPKGGPKGPLWGFRYGKPYPFVSILELMLALYFYFFVFVKFSFFCRFAFLLHFWNFCTILSNFHFFSKFQKKHSFDSGPIEPLSTYNLNISLFFHFFAKMFSTKIISSKYFGRLFLLPPLPSPLPLLPSLSILLHLLRAARSIAKSPPASESLLLAR